MTAGETFQGFEDRARNATIVVSEFSAQSYEQAAEQFGDEQMRAGGMEPLSRETIDTPGGPALLVGARQTENGVALRKWALLMRAADLTGDRDRHDPGGGARCVSGHGAARRARHAR